MDPTEDVQDLEPLVQEAAALLRRSQWLVIWVDTTVRLVWAKKRLLTLVDPEGKKWWPCTLKLTDGKRPEGIELITD
jgi:hypothetical protein